MRRIAVVGSRDYPDMQRVQSVVALFPDDTVVVSGGARGVDTEAIRAAKFHGMKTCVWKADWDNIGRGAGYARNAQIVADVDTVFAFWDGRSRGTQHTVSLARAAGKAVYVFGPDGTLMRSQKE